jgi:hypothetical protein
MPLLTKTSHKVVGKAAKLDAVSALSLYIYLSLSLDYYFGQSGRPGTGRRNTLEIAFYVGHKDRHPKTRKNFGHGLKSNGFAGACGAGDDAVAVGLVRSQEARRGNILCNQDRFGLVAVKKYNCSGSVTNF